MSAWPELLADLNPQVGIDRARQSAFGARVAGGHHCIGSAGGCGGDLRLGGGTVARGERQAGASGLVKGCRVATIAVCRGSEAATLPPAVVLSENVSDDGNADDDNLISVLKLQKSFARYWLAYVYLFEYHFNPELPETPLCDAYRGRLLLSADSLSSWY